MIQNESQRANIPVSNSSSRLRSETFHMRGSAHDINAVFLYNCFWITDKKKGRQCLQILEISLEWGKMLLLLL